MCYRGAASTVTCSKKVTASTIGQAAILCGGLGTRLCALTAAMPKPLLPVGERPFLEILLDELGRMGIKRSVLLAGFSADRIADYVRGFERLAGLADYVTVNVSSPNTPGLRGLQHREELQRLLQSLTDAHARSGKSKPLLLKIAPDLDEQAMDDIADVVLSSGIEGLIVSNTTISRPASLKSPGASEAGGLSGKPLFEPSTAILKQMRMRIGTRVVLVGVGGITNGADAYAKIRAGASLVQLYTALAYQGPSLVARIKRELLQCLTRDDCSQISDAIVADVM